MTLVADPVASPRRPRNAWDAPLWAHVGALAVVLLVLMPLIGTGSSFSADEGAVLVQARSLSRGEGWIVEHPVPEVDPDGVNYPLEFSERGPSGVTPFGKHPLYALMLAAADRAGGIVAMVLLSLLGTVAAAGLAGALARRLDPAIARPAVWVVGLASPLFFHGYLLIAHSLGAGLAAAGVLAAITALERRSVVLAVAVVPALAACVLLRTEGLFIAAALAAVAGVVALVRRDIRVVAGVIAGGSLVAGAAAHFLENWWTLRLLGGGGFGGVGGTGATAGSDLVSDRIHGFVVTWLTPGYGGRVVTGLALLVMAAAVAAGAGAVRWRPADDRRIRLFALVAGAGALLALVSGPTTVVPGLLLAFPLVVAGLVLVRGSTLSTVAARIAAGVSVLFVVAVIATQYAKGGGGEWGGRYFALAIPLYVPVLLLALRDAGTRLSARSAGTALAALAVCSIVMTTMGVGALRSSHRASARLVAAADVAGRSVADIDPVMVTTQGSVPRFAWSTFDRQRWLLAPPEGLEDLLSRLRAAGVARVGFVTRDLERDLAVLERAGVDILGDDGSLRDRGWHVLVLGIG